MGRDAQPRHVPAGLRTARAAVPLAVLGAVGALLGAAFPFLVSVTAWPEIVTPAWFVAHGLRLYDAIFFPHTPLLILLTAAAGSAFGFTATLLRAIPALSLAASGALVAIGTRPLRRSGPAAGLLAGVPLLFLLTVYTDGPALWPEPFLAPFAAAGVLLLERFARGGKTPALVAAGLVFGVGILIKQTFAWCALGALLWLVLDRRRRGLVAARFAGAVALPYVSFVLLWALAFRTLAHVRWTFLLPAFSRLSGEIAVPPARADLLEAVWLFLPFAALALLSRTLSPARFGSPAFLAALGCVGMAWPRWGLLHLGGMTALSALVASRATLVASVAVRRAFRRRAPARRMAEAAGGGSLLLAFFVVGILGAGPLLVDARGGPVFRWDDSGTRALASAVKARVAPGKELLVYDSHQALYPLTGTFAPGGFYVNPFFWYCLNKEGLDARLVAALRASPGLPVLVSPPDADASRIQATRVHAFLEAETAPDGPAAGNATWRRVRAP